jgi:hypothetical protein
VTTEKIGPSIVGSGVNSGTGGWYMVATPLTVEWWRSHYGGLPPAMLTTEVDPTKVRRKRDPGSFVPAGEFLRAGWRYADGKKGGRPVLRNGLVVLVAMGVVG